jgi:hypothetical protein
MWTEPCNLRGFIYTALRRRLIHFFQSEHPDCCLTPLQRADILHTCLTYEFTESLHVVFVAELGSCIYIPCQEPLYLALKQARTLLHLLFHRFVSQVSFLQLTSCARYIYLLLSIFTSPGGPAPPPSIC